MTSLHQPTTLRFALGFFAVMLLGGTALFGAMTALMLRQLRRRERARKIVEDLKWTA